MAVTTRRHTEMARRPRRQWGGDRRERPSSVLPPPISDRRIAVARVAIVLTVAAWVGYFVDWLDSEFVTGGASSTQLGVEAVIYLLVVSLLTASALAYLICRLGYLLRSSGHRRVPRAALDDFFAQSMPTMTVIVPSYREETRVVRTTLLSAALQEYPYLRVVLLVDDPPNPASAHHRELLAGARSLPAQIDAVLAEPREHFAGLLERFERDHDELAGHGESMLALADAYEDAVTFLNQLADAQEIVDHSDAFFADHVVRRLAADLAVTAAAVRAALGDGVLLPAERQLQLYRRLAWIFRAEISSFERKQYASLSHEPNKAMNLNSYIGLMGGSYRDVVTVSGRVLLPAPLGLSDLDVPDPDYVLTLDADSVLMPEYCLRLVHLMEQSEHARVAVAQTPYSAYPGAATRLERIAGATTDLQHIVHQGMTHYDATFWVGANAVLRKRALDEIADVVYAGNFPVRRYIRDRTVIEDTESTIDLASKGWSLFNYPERLSYSATPPDFGALCIQRRRWANGGLLILPRLRRQVKERRARGERTRFGELFLRTNYMASIAWASASLIFLLAFPFANRLVSPWLGLIALPYFAAMASDLRHCGYKGADVARIYGFNLVLTPVNLAGVGNSIVQGLTGDKSVFGRTPKVRNRTIPNLFFIVAPYLIVGLAVWTLWNDWYGHRWDDFVYAALNTVLTTYAILAFIGLRHSITDTFVQLKARLYRVESARHKPVRDPAAIVADPAVADWASVLYFGTTGASPLVGTVPMAAQGGRAAPVTLARPPALDSAGRGAPGGRSDAGSGAGAAGAGSGAEPGGNGTGRGREAAAGGGRGPRSGAPSAGSGQHAGAGHHLSGEVEPIPDRPSISADVSFRTVYQPIVALEGGRVVGYEALTRFDDGVGPDRWLAEAAAQGTGVELETMLTRAAVMSARKLPEDAVIGLNVSGDFVRAGSALRSIVESTTRSIVLEIDRHVVTDPAIGRVLAELPRRVTLGITGASPSYDILNLVRELRPGVVKLEREWVHQVYLDAARQVLIRALVAMAEENQCLLIAEGVESSADLEALRQLGVGFGQGFLLGRPSALATT
ncbi:MAG TPA: glycosyltransferase family 2 protein [Acidimicrobiales bacterium]|nr:glycosyltransferase family 2 protein [Acidimicrobiales bacterium]